MTIQRLKIPILVLVGLFWTTGLFAQEALRPGDVVRVWVKGEAELTVERTVGSDGSIAYPLLGSVGVAGLRPYEAAKVVAQHLTDGYLREPLVQVTLVRKGSTTASPARPGANRPAAPSTESLSEMPPVVAAPLGGTAAPAPSPAPTSLAESKPVSFEILDRESGKGVGGAALFFRDKIYQSNRLGQVVIQGTSGRIIVLADGFKLLQGDLAELLKQEPKPHLQMDAVTFPDVISIQVLDAATRLPVPGVQIKLDTMAIQTNKSGIFRIRKIRRPFGEVELTKKGYRALKKVLDLSGPAEQVILLVRNE